MTKKLRITVEGKAYEVTVEVLGDGEVVASSPRPAPAAPPPAPAQAPASKPTETKPPAPPAGQGDVPSPLAGKVVGIDVRIGDKVEEGQNIMTLEAMKMNTYVTSPTAGEVKSINVHVGDSVDEGQSLMNIS